MTGAQSARLGFAVGYGGLGLLCQRQQRLRHPLELVLDAAELDVQSGVLVTQGFVAALGAGNVLFELVEPLAADHRPQLGQAFLAVLAFAGQ